MDDAEQRAQHDRDAMDEAPQSRGERRGESLVAALRRFKILLLLGLLVFMNFMVLVTALEVAYFFIRDLLSPPLLVLEINEILDLFSLFLLVLIGVELADTVQAYLEDESVHVETVLLVALTAIARKALVLDTKEVSGLGIVGIAAMIAALAYGFHLIQAQRKKHE